MPRDKGDPALLKDMVEAAEAVGRFLTGKSQADFNSNELLRAGVERKIEIIGEAARALSDGLQKAHPEVPWRKIMATRHILAHDYDVVDTNIVWTIATVYVPALIDQLRPLIPPPPPDPEPEDGGSIA